MPVMMFLGCLLAMVAPDGFTLIISSFAGGWLASFIARQTMNRERLEANAASEDGVERTLARFRLALLSGDEAVTFLDILIRGSAIFLTALLLRAVA